MGGILSGVYCFFPVTLQSCRLDSYTGTDHDDHYDYHDYDLSCCSGVRAFLSYYTILSVLY